MNEPVLERCLEYSEGTVSREELVEFLATYDYVPSGATDGYDSLIVDPPGTWSEVATAHRRGYIDDSIYEEVFYIRHTTWEASQDED